MSELLARVQDTPYLITVLHLALGAVLSLALQWLYVRFGRSLSNRWEFSRIFPLITLCVIVVISVVKSSMALSLGLIGALSIVRFRTPVKEPEELTFLFIAISIGIGLGADQVAFTVTSTLCIFAAIILLGGKRKAGRSQSLYLSVASVDDGVGLDVTRVAKAISDKFPSSDIRRVDSTQSETRASFQVVASDSAQLLTFVEGFRREYPSLELVVVEQQRVPGV